MKRRRFLGILASSTALAACSNSVAMRTASSAFENSFGNKSAFDPGYPEQLPYASIAVSIKNMNKALLILGKIEGDDLHWVSADRSVLVTRHGRLVKTVGLNENLIKTDFPAADFFENWSADKKSSTAARIVDLTPGNRYGVKIESSLKAMNRETIGIGNKTYQTTRFDEHCVAPLLSWEFTNSYWADDHGTVWRSRQHTTPASPVITIEVTKPHQA